MIGAGLRRHARTPAPASARSRPAVQPGMLLAGKFRVERVLAVGGMGVVAAAHHAELDQQVAVKLMLPSTDGARAVRRFIQEARATARLCSEHVVRVLDAGVLDDGARYIAMELLDGVDLGTLLRRAGRVPGPVAAALIAEAAEALVDAHAAGVIHRDLKPSNLFIARRRDGSALVKVLDFGVCRLLDAASAATGAAQLVGTPAYMAPEQMRSAHSADERSDLWSLGVILYQLVTGRLPFTAASYAEICVRATLEPFAPLDDVEPAFASIVARCLEKDPTARFADARSLVDALAPWRRPLDLPALLPASELPPTVTATASAITGPRWWRRPATGALALAVAVAGYGITAGMATPAAPPPPVAIARRPAASIAAAPAPTTSAPAEPVPAAPAAEAPPRRRQPRRPRRATPPDAGVAAPDVPARMIDPLANPD